LAFGREGDVAPLLLPTCILLGNCMSRSSTIVDRSGATAGDVAGAAGTAGDSADAAPMWFAYVCSMAVMAGAATAAATAATADESRLRGAGRGRKGSMGPLRYSLSSQGVFVRGVVVRGSTLMTSARARTTIDTSAIAVSGADATAVSNADATAESAHARHAKSKGTDNDYDKVPAFRHLLVNCVSVTPVDCLLSDWSPWAECSTNW
jgi:hypothetical protein